MALADSLGVDRAEVLGLLGTGRMSSAVAAAKARKMDSGDDSPDFALEWAVKDMGLALDAAPDRRLAVLDALRNRWQELVDQGLSGLDTSAARHGLDGTVPPSPPSR
jgi:3-hydroxyisobutyrate dehydrogenase